VFLGAPMPLHLLASAANSYKARPASVVAGSRAVGTSGQFRLGISKYVECERATDANHEGLRKSSQAGLFGRQATRTPFAVERLHFEPMSAK
jgi:hypothetical protein